VDRTAAAGRYAELPLPNTTDEHWRFTDLRGFDPDSFVRNGQVQGPGPQIRPAETLLEVDVAAMAVVDEGGISIVENAPEGVTFEPLTDHERLGQLVGTDEKFAAHNAAVWEHGLLVTVPKGVELEQPLSVRIVNSLDGGALFFRLLVIAEPESRFTLIEEYVSSTPEVAGYTNTVSELFVEQAAKLEYVSIQRLSPATWHFASHHARVERDAELDWVAGGFGSKKGKVWIQNDLTGQGATSRVTGAYFADGEQHLDYDTYQLHSAPNTTSDFAFKGALRDKATAVWRGMIRDGRPGRPRAALLPDGPRPFSQRGRAADRARLLHRRARPNRARAGARGARRGPRGPHPTGLKAFKLPRRWGSSSA
jgi:Fe-S cluster assembly protein SufD